jgi:hypothetical protein
MQFAWKTASLDNYAWERVKKYQKVTAWRKYLLWILRSILIVPDNL